MKFFLIIPLLFVLVSCSVTKEDKTNKYQSNISSNDSIMTNNSQNEWTKTSSSNSYLNYTPELVTESIKSGKTVALFFHASWCPSCRSLDKTIQANLNSIPENTVILKVNYDNSSDLKKQYNVVTQHTTIVLNPDLTSKYRKIGAQKISDILGK